jgi:hypothetical protein
LDLPPIAVHRLGQRRVGLVADRAERHGTGREALDDLLGRLDLVERQRLVGPLELHQAAKVSSRSFCSLISLEYSA